MGEGCWNFRTTMYEFTSAVLIGKDEEAQTYPCPKHHLRIEMDYSSSGPTSPLLSWIQVCSAILD
jgi:hypothetical protein